MLAPRYLEGIADELVDIYSNLEIDILTDISRRLAKLKRIDDLTSYQFEILAEIGGIQKNAAAVFRKYDKEIAQELERVYLDAMKRNTRTNNKIFKEATGREVSEPEAQRMLAIIQKAHSDLERLTMTTATTAQEQFIKEANRMFTAVSSGAFNYDKALEMAVDELAGQGVYTVQYENTKPTTRTIESAVRMNLLTGINQTAATITLDNAQELGADLVEVTAHIGARPEHAAWQGKIYSLSGTSAKYPNFAICGYGSATGICGINCRHNFYPFFEGLPKHYTPEELDEINDQPVVYNGQQITRYDGEQKLREIERTIRKYKRRAATEKAAGVDDTRAREYLGKWDLLAKDFTQQTGIRRERAREYIGTPRGRQPKPIYKKE